MSKKYLFNILLVSLLMLLYGCKSHVQAPGPRIMVTIEPIRFFAQEIAGDGIEVLSQVPKGASPETYDITPQQLVELSSSIAYLRIGNIGFEKAWMERLCQTNPSMRIFDLSQGINMIHSSNGAEEPHIWTSTKNAHIIAANILSALKELFPEQSDGFQQRYNQLTERISETEQQIEKLASKIQNRSFLIYHPTLTYFARDWNLEQICIEEDGKEPSIQQLRDLTTRSIQEGVKTIFIQPEFDHENAKIIAAETGSEITEIYPLSYNWCEEMIRIAEVLSKK